MTYPLKQTLTVLLSIVACVTTATERTLGQSASVGLFDPLTAELELELTDGPWTQRLIEPRNELTLFPIAGDWDGDGVDSFGLYDRDSDEFHLKNYSDGFWDPSTSTFADRTYFADHVIQFSIPDSGGIPIAGDWDGDGVDSVGLYAPATAEFHFRNSYGDDDDVFRILFGKEFAGWVPLVGDWDGDGIDTVGFFDPMDSRFVLRNADHFGEAEITFQFGPEYAGWTPLVGDWNKNGVDSIGLYDPERSQYHLKNAFAGGDADFYFQFGSENCGWTPLSGDWDGDGVDSIGLYNSLRDSLEDKYDYVRSEFHLRNAFSGGNADIRVGFGWHNDYTAVAGDWDGDGLDGVGIYDPVTATFFLSENLDSVDHQVTFGNARSGWIPIAGDWDGDQKDTIGLYDPVNSAFHLKNSLSGGDADIVLYFGIPASEWLPIAGDWDGDGIDTIGLYWREKSEFHLKNSHDGFFADIVFQFGSVLQGFEEGPILNWPGNFPVVGDWNNDGIETVGLYNPEFSVFYLLDEHRSAPLSGADQSFPFGWSGASFWVGAPGAGRWPLAGRW